MAKSKNSKSKSSKKKKSTQLPPEKSILFKYFQLVFYLLGAWYFLAGIIFLFGLFTLRFNDSLFLDQAIMILIKNPVLSFVPLPLTFSGVLFVYAGVKIIMASKRAFWTAVVVLVTVPVLIMGMNTMIHYLEFKSMNKFSSFVDYYFGSDYFEFKELDLIFYLVFFGSFVVLLLSYRKFTRPDKLISSRSRTTLIVMILLGVLPAIFFGLYSFLVTVKTDYGLSKVQNNLDIEVMEPSWIPEGLTYATFYFLDDNENYGRGSEVYYDSVDSAFHRGILNQDNMVVGLKQYEYDSDKGIRYYHDSYLINRDGCTTQEYEDAESETEGMITECTDLAVGAEDIDQFSIFVTSKNGNVIIVETPSRLITVDDLIEIGLSMK